ncbi:hypothetical protein [Aeromonas cavernicola]|uniref:Lipoprotein n=1 Tax=Aeromonas cavernicola TaxID=1006623 RepID=A0A2H9U6I7_9GAMM|nr:hypothetical protein [Aeromonas cavernicola]PJG59594.1 hypothetical protein CUC53_06635 [Aeromonas cavernicola]
MRRLGLLTTMAGLLAGCSLPPPPAPQQDLALERVARLESANKALQHHLHYADWLLTTKPTQRQQERLRLRADHSIDSQVSLAMINTHPQEPVASRRAGLTRLTALLPQLGRDSQTFLRSWIALAEALLAKECRCDEQRQEIQRLRHQIEQLSAIDEHIYRRKRN